MGSETVWLAVLGGLIGIGMAAGVVALGRSLSLRRREVLHHAFAERCPSCQRLGGLRRTARERIPGTLRRVTSKGEKPPAWVARYRVFRRCLYCGSIKVTEEEGPAEPPVSGIIEDFSGEQ